jgi:hypothetical protein
MDVGVVVQVGVVQGLVSVSCVKVCLGACVDVVFRGVKVFHLCAHF